MGLASGQTFIKEQTMTLGEISEPLGKRGFVTREKWCREYDNPEVVGTTKCVLHFGMDNVAWLCLRENDLIQRQSNYGRHASMTSGPWTGSSFRSSGMGHKMTSFRLNDS